MAALQRDTFLNGLKCHTAILTLNEIPEKKSVRYTRFDVYSTKQTMTQTSDHVHLVFVFFFFSLLCLAAFERMLIGYQTVNKEQYKANTNVFQRFFFLFEIIMLFFSIHLKESILKRITINDDEVRSIVENSYDV